MQEQITVTLEMFKAADDARTTYLRDIDANDQIGALNAALEAAVKVINKEFTISYHRTFCSQ